MKLFWILLFVPACFCLNPVESAKTGKRKFRKRKDDKDDPTIVLPLLVRGPYLQQATPNSMLIRWRTDALCRSRVRFGNDPAALKNEVTDSALVTEHKVLLTSLKPETRYYYSIGDVKNTLQGDTGNYFYTLPVAGSKPAPTGSRLSVTAATIPSISEMCATSCCNTWDRII